MFFSLTGGGFPVIVIQFMKNAKPLCKRGTMNQEWFRANAKYNEYMQNRREE